MTNNLPTILISNDDGIEAPGIKALISYTKELGRVVVVAPNKERSSFSSALTLRGGISVSEFNKDGITYYSCSGTPADCVKLAITELLLSPPDLILSGINNGSNAAINILYSGTVAIAIEGLLSKIPSIAFSLVNTKGLEPSFEHAKEYIQKLVKESLDKKNPSYCLNVNIPFFNPKENIKGVKYSHQAPSHWKESYTFVDKKYYLGGKFCTDNQYNNSDQWALDNNYIAITPIQLDFTDYEVLKKIKNEGI